MEMNLAQKLYVDRSNVVKPAITFHQKISTFTLRVNCLKPYKGRMQHTAHSNLMEVDQETELVDHEVALLSLVKLVYTTFRNNIDKVVLIENVTDKVIWNYWGKLDRYPFDVKFERTPEGHNFIRSYKYQAWDKVTNKYIWMPEVNVIRDHFAKLQEKINLNFEWHKSEWRRKAGEQAQREMAATGKPEGKGAIENYNLKQLSEMITNLKQVK